MTTALSLYSIEETLEQLAEERRLSVLEGDSAAIEAIDKAHGDYLAQRGESVPGAKLLERGEHLRVI